MAVRVGSISRLDDLQVLHKGSEFTLCRTEEGALHIPFAYASAISRTVQPVKKGEIIPFKRVLRPTQIAPTMVMKLRLNSEGSALNAQGCGDGKTTQAFWIISQFSPERTLIVTHRTDLATQWQNEGKECTGLIVWRAEKPTEVCMAARIVVVMVHVMEQLPKQFLRSVDLLIVDECERIASVVFGKSLLLCTPKRILGLTATPGEINSNNVDPSVALLYGTKPILPGTRKPFKVVRILYPFKPVEKQHWYINKKGVRTLGPDWTALTSSIAFNHERNLYIARLVKAFVDADPNNKIFIFVKLANQVDCLKHIFTELKIEVEKVYRNKRPKCARVYIGTYSKGEAGFDEKILEGFDGIRINIVLLAADVIDSRQAIGRGFRYEGLPLVLEILDDNKYLREYHAQNRAKYYEENGAVSIKTLKHDELDLGEEILKIQPLVIEKKPAANKKAWTGWKGRGYTKKK